ncbi:hypothetical protein C8R42DRAFT_729903 [Lentinula raphanica]|nr:hypothetical protein C8R42DRAFT_729903 [Lentinula raphanica]
MRLTSVLLLGLVSAIYGLPNPGLPYFKTPPDSGSAAHASKIQIKAEYDKNFESVPPIHPPWRIDIELTTKDAAVVIDRSTGEASMGDYHSGEDVGEKLDYEPQLQVIFLENEDQSSFQAEDDGPAFSITLDGEGIKEFDEMALKYSNNFEE